MLEWLTRCSAATFQWSFPIPWLRINMLRRYQQPKIMSHFFDGAEAEANNREHESRDAERVRLLAPPLKRSTLSESTFKGERLSRDQIFYLPMRRFRFEPPMLNRNDGNNRNKNISFICVTWYHSHFVFRAGAARTALDSLAKMSLDIAFL